MQLIRQSAPTYCRSDKLTILLLTEEYKKEKMAGTINCVRTLSEWLSAKRANILAPAPTPNPITDFSPKCDKTNNN